MGNINGCFSAHRGIDSGKKCGGDLYKTDTPKIAGGSKSGKIDTLPEQMIQHTVPFVIWANFDIEEKDLGLTSLSYLSTHLLDAAGLQRTAYHEYLAQQEQIIPAMNMLGYYSNEQGSFVSFSQAEGAEAEAEAAYKKMQYNALFDKTGRSETFFGQYLPKK